MDKENKVMFRHNIFTPAEHLLVFMPPKDQFVSSYQRKSPRQQRREALEEALAVVGLRLRRDSKLCQSYIQTGRGDLRYIVDKMHEMDWYHTKTDYEHFFKQFKHQLTTMPDDTHSDVAANPVMVKKIAAEKAKDLAITVMMKDTYIPNYQNLPSLVQERLFRLRLLE